MEFAFETWMNICVTIDEKILTGEIDPSDKNKINELIKSIPQQKREERNKKIQIARIGKDFYDNKRTKYHNGLAWTEEGEAILNDILNEKVFTCPECEQKVSFNELEYWGEDVELIANDEIVCSICYEKEMGENL